MATSVSAALTIDLNARIDADASAATAATGAVVQQVVNNTGGRRWTNGTASGQVDRVYKASATLSASATDSYNMLAAGSLTDIYGQAIDADELKGFVVKCITGEITVQASASNGLGCFKAASDGIVLAAGQSLGLDFGAGGLDVTTNATVEVDDSGGAGSTYEIGFIVAQ